jgi:hypothetical protein
VADSGNHRVCKIEGGTVSAVAGPSGAQAGTDAPVAEGGHVDGSASEARFNNPVAVTVTALGDIYVADMGNAAVRKISGGAVSTLRVIDAETSEVYPVAPAGIINDANTLYVSDRNSGAVLRIENRE